jgi:hypothetical protein
MPLTGETFHEKTKGKDVRTSNIIAAKVSNFFKIEFQTTVIFIKKCGD